MRLPSQAFRRNSTRVQLRVDVLEDRCLLSSVPFTIGGAPFVDPHDFRITTFATGLNYPYSLVELSDGSLLVGTSRPAKGSLFDSTGELLRLVDADHDGVADGPGTVLFTGLPGVLTALRQAGNLFFVTSSAGGSEQIAVLRAGATPADPLSLLGSINFAFPADWEHTTYELAVRPSPATPGDYDLFFNVGSPTNTSTTTTPIPISGLLTGSLRDSSIYMVTVHDSGSTPVFSNLTQVASGLRNAASMAFDAHTGALWFADNGIDGGGEPEEELSADKLNSMSAAQIGGPVQDFGFPSTYIDYQTGRQVGTQGIPPEVAFLPSAIGGSEIAGAAKLTLAPPGFPGGLNTGLFVGFHGLTASGGPNNDENPVAYVDLATNTFFPFIAGSQEGVGHLDGLLATQDSLFLADLSTNGDLFHTAQGGAIYEIQALPATSFQVAAPASVVAGTPFDITVTARNAAGHVAAGYTGTVAFSTTDPNLGVVLPANYTFTAADHGMHTFTAGGTLFTAGNQTLTATDTSDGAVRGTGGVTVTPAPADHFFVSAPDSALSGMPFDVTVVALDPYGNIDSNYQGTVSFSTSDLGPGVVLPAEYTFTADNGGVHTFTNMGLGETTLVTPGDQTLSATETPSGLLTGSATVMITLGRTPPAGWAGPNQPPKPGPSQVQYPKRLEPSGQEVLAVDWVFASFREEEGPGFSWWVRRRQPGTSW
jgi:glucose/arabinose dehydrogenase